MLVYRALGLVFAPGCGVDHGSGGSRGGTFAISTTVRPSTWSGMPILRRRPPLVVHDDGIVAACVLSCQGLLARIIHAGFYCNCLPVHVSTQTANAPL